MKKKKLIISIVFKITSATIVLAGIIMNMIDPWGASVGLNGLAVFMYYTLQSNLLVFGVFVALIVRDIKLLIKMNNNQEATIPQHSILSRIQGGTVVVIALTFLVFWALLAPPVFSPETDLEPSSLLEFTNLSTHLLAAILMTIDFFVFTPRGSLFFKDLWLFLIAPAYYLVFATIAGFAGVVYYTHADGNPMRFPYGFMDYDRTGWLVIPWIIGIAIIYYGMSLGLYWLDRKKIKAVNISQ